METPTTIPPGTRVTHPVWGTGTVIRNRGPATMYIEFDTPSERFNVTMRYVTTKLLTINAGTAP